MINGISSIMNLIAMVDLELIGSIHNGNEREICSFVSSFLLGSFLRYNK